MKKQKKDKLRERLIQRITNLIELVYQECDVDYPQFYYTVINRCMEIAAVGDGITVKTVVPDDPAKWLNNFNVIYKEIMVFGTAFQLIDRLQNVKDRIKKDCDNNGKIL